MEQKILNRRVRIWDPEDSECKSFGSLFASNKEENNEQVFGFWHLLPELLLERIYQFLTIRERYYASQVCRNWYLVYNLPRVWYIFSLYDGLLTKRKFNYYAGWEKLLDHFRVTIFLTKRGEFIRTMIFHPMKSLFNLYEFLNMSYYMHFKIPGILSNVDTLRFHFSCHLEERSEEVVFGTGGQVLNMLKKVLGILNNLKTLELVDLLLDTAEGVSLLDEVCVACCETLNTLILVNVTKLAQTLIHPGAFINLSILVISPQNISEDLLELIGSTNLRNMHIVQNKYSENGRSLHYEVWKRCRKSNPNLRVHLKLEGNSKQYLIRQPRAPTKSIIYDSPFSKITVPIMLQTVETYNSDLEVFGHTQLPRFYMPKTFHERIDSSLLLLVRRCPYIHTLVVRERVSTCTVLLIAHTAKNLHLFYVRRNAIILKADWPQNPDWSKEFYSWLKASSKSYEAMEKEVSQILGYRWQSLTDKQFKMVNIDVNKPFYMFS